jgi:glycosyltransferase involved in cell wall biosynthesis
MKSVKPKFLSVIVPAYKQERTIRKDLGGILSALEGGLGGEYSFEIICVVDGQSDNTAGEASKLKSSKVRVFSYVNNKGKGYAVRFGMKKALGDIISFLDAGMDISPNGIMMLLAHLNWYNADVIVGSKKHPVSRVNYPFLRRILSWGYHLGVKILFDLPLSDTQSGIKIFKRNVIEKILPRLLVKRYAMDVEMLAVAKHLGFGRIYEAPIEVTFNKSTSRIDWTTIFKMMWDTAAVFYRLKILRYYDDRNSKNWIAG